jgi:oligopeptide transport system substrate-binding protein
MEKGLNSPIVSIRSLRDIIRMLKIHVSIPCHALSRGLLDLCLIGIIGSLVFSGCGTSNHTSKESTQRVFTLNLATEPPDLDPAKITDLTSFTVVMNLFRGLTLLNGDNQVEPALAERWTVSPDGKHYVFHLRQNAVWSDGKPVTAYDFLDGWKRALTPDTGSEYAFFLFDIQGAKDFYDGTLKDFHQTGVKALSAKTLSVQLNRPVPFFTALMASPVSYPTRLDLLEKYRDKYAEAGNLVSCGPYLLKTWQHEDQIELTPNPTYYGPKPQVDLVRMLMINDANTSVVMYENGELDYIETPSSIPSFDVRRLQNRPDYHKGLMYALYYLGFNTRLKPFDDVRVRKAFAMAVDRRIFPQLLQSGQRPLAGLIPPGMTGHNDQTGIEFNPSQAKALLAEAGYPDGKGFPEVNFAFRSLYDIQKEAEIVQSQFKEHLNVPVRLKNMEWKVFLKALSKPSPENPIHLYRLSWFADYPDPDTFMSLFIKESGNNYTGWSDAQYDQWTKQAVVTLSSTQRAQLYEKAQRRLLQEQAIIVPFFMAEKGYLLNPRVNGIQVNALNVINLDQLRVGSASQVSPP